MKFFTLILFMTFSITYLDAQVSENANMSPNAEMSPNAQVLPAAINYKEFQRNFIELNKITRQEIYRYEIKHDGQGDSILLWASNFIYDNKNRIIEQQNFDHQQTLLSIIYFYYNASNMLIKETISDSKKREPGTEINNVNFTYDILGRIEYTSYYNRDTSFLTSIKNVYNDSNRIIKHLQKFEANNELLRTETQKLAFEVYNKIFKVDEFQIVDTLFYNSENKVVRIQNYDMAHIVSFSYLIDYFGFDPTEITVTKQTQQNKYIVGKMRINKLNQILLRSVAPEDTEVVGYDSKNDKSEKFYYNIDGTLNTCIGYNGKKVKYIYKFVYKK